MKELLYKLTALRFYAKTVHYFVKGTSQYGNHLFADAILDDLTRFWDDIQEVCYLGSERLPPYCKDVLNGAVGYIPNMTNDEEAMFRNLKELIVSILKEIEILVPECSVGEQNLLGNIAERLQQMNGLLYRRLK